MQPSASLLAKASRITLFTRAHCSLCDDAAKILRRVYQRRPYLLKKIDVMAKGRKPWRDLYEYDTPVVCVLSVFGGMCVG